MARVSQEDPRVQAQSFALQCWVHPQLQLKVPDYRHQHHHHLRRLQGQQGEERLQEAESRSLLGAGAGVAASADAVGAEAGPTLEGILARACRDEAGGAGESWASRVLEGEGVEPKLASVVVVVESWLDAPWYD